MLRIYHQKYGINTRHINELIYFYGKHWPEIGRSQHKGGEWWRMEDEDMLYNLLKRYLDIEEEKRDRRRLEKVENDKIKQ